MHSPMRLHDGSQDRTYRRYVVKLRILSDVAPYSREYQKRAGALRREARGNSDLTVELERIDEQVRRTKESTLQVAQKHFNAPVDRIEGTVKRASSEGVELEEYPGRTFRFGSLGMPGDFCPSQHVVPSSPGNINPPRAPGPRRSRPGVSGQPLRVQTRGFRHTGSGTPASDTPGSDTPGQPVRPEHSRLTRHPSSVAGIPWRRHTPGRGIDNVVRGKGGTSQSF
jgi:hypothetical protein